MDRIKMRQRLILFALCLFALVRCGSNCSSKNSNANPTPNPNPNADANPTQTPAPRIKSESSVEFESDSSQVPPFPPSQKQTINFDENAGTKSGQGIDSNSDSDSDYQMAPNVPDVEYYITPTIIKGSGVDEQSGIPYQLSIRFQEKPPFGPWLHLCGGVILDENTALTAAHCFGKTSDASRYRVTAGENLLNVTEETEQILQVQKVVIHPEYTDISNGHDIAILHLDKIQLNDYARGVWLSPFHNREITNLTGVISGWGKGSLLDSAQVSNSLQKGNVTVLSSKDCHPRLRRLRVAVAGILCAVNPDIRACNGDSGGPLVIQNYKLGDLRGNLLVGIISFGVGKCDIKNSAGFFTEIRYFYDWIQENRAKKPCGENYLPCVTGGCFQTDFRCDKKEDCADGTDEIGCSGRNTKTTATATRKTFSSCSDVMEILTPPVSKKQTIYPHGNNNNNNRSLEVLCDFETDGGGWTIIQKRSSGPREEFQQNWNDYAKGFGSLDGNFWLGLDNIRALTKNGDQELRIELEDFEGEKRWAKYSNFSISDASDFYRLAISGFSPDSTAGDSMTNSSSLQDWILNGMRFSTSDKDNDVYNGNCAKDFGGGGGWWFAKCSDSWLNGLYREKGEPVPRKQGIVWQSWRGSSYSLAKTEMKIRKKTT